MSRFARLIPNEPTEALPPAAEVGAPLPKAYVCKQVGGGRKAEPLSKLMSMKAWTFRRKGSVEPRWLGRRMCICERVVRDRGMEERESWRGVAICQGGEGQGR